MHSLWVPKQCLKNHSVWQEDDRQVEGLGGAKAFFQNKQTSFDNHDWDLGTGGQALINFKSKSKTK